MWTTRGIAPGRFAKNGKEDEMSTISLTDVDVRVRDRVRRQLDWDPEVDASGIGVTAKNGVVTLTGYIDTYAGKLAAERAAKRVRGVRGIANDLEVRLTIRRLRRRGHALRLGDDVAAARNRRTRCGKRAGNHPCEERDYCRAGRTGRRDLLTRGSGSPPRGGPSCAIAPNVGTDASALTPG